MTNLKGEFVIQVALGKAHAVALTNKGYVYSFGINNKFQCGREFITSNKEGNITKREVVTNNKKVLLFVIWILFIFRKHFKYRCNGYLWGSRGTGTLR